MMEFDLKNVSLIVITVLLIYKLYRKKASYFERRNVKTPDSFPLFGFMYEVLFKKRHVTKVFREYYNQFSDSRFEKKITFVQSFKRQRDWIHECKL